MKKKWKILTIIMAVLIVLGISVKVATDKIFSYLLLSSIIGSDIEINLNSQNQDDKLEIANEDSTQKNKENNIELSEKKQNTDNKESNQNDDVNNNVSTDINSNEHKKGTNEDQKNTALKPINETVKNNDNLSSNIDSSNINSSPSNKSNDEGNATISNNPVDYIESKPDKEEDNSIESDKTNNIIKTAENNNEKTMDDSADSIDNIASNIDNEIKKPKKQSFAQKILGLFKRNDDSQIADNSHDIEESETGKNGNVSKPNNANDSNTLPITPPSDKNDNDADDIIKEVEKKVSFADKAKASQILLSKLTPSDISALTSLVKGGKVTDEEINQAKKIIKEKVTAEEKEALKSLFNKYEGLLDDL